MTAKKRNARSEARGIEGLVADELAAGYDALNAVGGVPKDESAEFLGSVDIADRLRELGVARVVAATASTPALFQAVPLHFALPAVASNLLSGAVTQVEQLAEALHRLNDALPPLHQPTTAAPEHLLRVITDPHDLARTSTWLINTARHDWMTLENGRTERPVSEDNNLSCPGGLRGTLRMRSIYDTSMLGCEASVRSMEKSRDEEGEEARILEGVPMKMQLADSYAVLLPLTITGVGASILVYDCPLTHAMRGFFELLWKQGRPFGGSAAPVPGSPLTEIQRNILKCLMQGQSDDTIARHVRRSERTVQRIVHDMTEELGVTGRFALGVAAERNGWISREED